MAKVLLENVSLEYPVLAVRSQSLRLALVNFGSAGRFAKDAWGNVTVAALNNINLEASDGDRIGLVGRNGAGKSTLLKLLTGIFAPSSGRVTIEGTVSAILGQGMNVDDELTGYEAVKYSCLMRGIPSQKIPEIQKDAEEFTELGDYLHMPLRTYSAGMRMRLAFAVATCDAPDILLLDEGIGAGDQFFLDRVRRRSEAFIRSANLLFLASHSNRLLREVCNKSILLDHGQIVAAGATEEVLEIYATLDTPSAKHPVVSLGVSPSVPQADSQSGDGDDVGAQPKPRVEAFASHDLNQHPPLAAFDGSPLTHWRTPPGEPVVDQAFVGLIFENPVHPRTAFVRQHVDSFKGGNCVSRIAIEVSEDGFKSDIRRAAEADMPATAKRRAIGLRDVGAGRWWRIVALSEPNDRQAGWAVSKFDLSPVPLPDWNEGRAVAGSMAADSVAPHFAFNGQNPTPWVSMEKGDEIAGAAWIGWDFGSNKVVSPNSVEVAQWDDGDLPNTVSQVLLQCSDDAFHHDVRTAASLELPNNTERLVLPIQTDQAARYWRLLAKEPSAGGHWGVAFLAFHTEGTEVSNNRRDSCVA